MGVVTCPGCGRMVSDKADDCPRCGCTLVYVRSTPRSELSKTIKYVKPQVDVYVPIGDGTRDRGEKLHTLYFNDEGINLAYQYNVTESYALSDIISVDCYQADKSRSNDAATMAATGLVLGGVAGAVVGGIVGAVDNVSWYFEVVTDDKLRTFRLQSESSRKSIIKWAYQHHLMTEDGISIPSRKGSEAQSSLAGQEARLIESYRNLLPEFRKTLQEQADSLLALQSRIKNS